MKIKKILFLTFYYEPDLCAGSFRAKALIDAFRLDQNQNFEVDVFTTMPNRYNSFKPLAQEFEQFENIKIYRCLVSSHKSGFLDQAYAYKDFYFKAIRLAKLNQYDLILATSSRLFTAFLGARIHKLQPNAILYFDIRDIFLDSISDVIKNPLLRRIAIPIITKIENFTFKNANHINLVSEGFKNYFETKYKANLTFFTNGIDEEFLNSDFTKSKSTQKKIITYAGNIGEGQGLHEIIPQIAKNLENNFHFLVIGDGGTKSELVEKLAEHRVNNVELLNPVNRKKLIEYYKETDYLFLHLNDYPAFEKVLPSKIFEYGATGKPIIAGVKGYASNFLLSNLPHTLLFEPKDSRTCIELIEKDSTSFDESTRVNFLKKFNRTSIMFLMKTHILNFFS